MSWLTLTDNLESSASQVKDYLDWPVSLEGIVLLIDEEGHPTVGGYIP